MTRARKPASRPAQNDGDRPRDGGWWLNRSASFGLPSRLLHWISALLILAAIPLGATIARMEVRFDNLWLFGLHKSLGLTAFAVLLIRLAWHRLTPPPRPIEAGIPRWQVLVARWVHAALYALMLFVPLAGWLAASATGIDTVLWGRIVVPPLTGPDRATAEIGFAVHRVLAWGLAGFVTLHVAGAIKRGLINRDGTLRRIIFGH